jgi:hypothetical protein
MRLGRPIGKKELEGGPAEEEDVWEEEGRQKNAQPHPDTPYDQMWRVDGGVERARSSSSSQIGVERG